MLPTVFHVALGGAIGASMRYMSGVAIFRMIGPQSFPLNILTVNIIGSALMGVFVVVAAQRGLTHWSPFVMTGILGGFTTFSAFSLEAVTLIDRGQLGYAALYILLSVICSVGALFLAMTAMRAVLA